MLALLKHPRVGTSVAHQCMYGLVTPDGKGGVHPAKKPTKFMSSSPAMLKRLQRVSDGKHQHQQLVGGRAAAAAFYPKTLIKEILRGMRDTADQEEAEDKPEEQHQQVMNAMLASHCTDPVPAHKEVSTKIRAQDIENKLSKAKIMFRYADGTTASLTPKWKDKYVDEYTSEELPVAFAKDALLDELQYFCKHVLVGVPASEVLTSGGKIIGTRWVS